MIDGTLLDLIREDLERNTLPMGTKITVSPEVFTYGCHREDYEDVGSFSVRDMHVTVDPNMRGIAYTLHYDDKASKEFLAMQATIMSHLP